MATVTKDFKVKSGLVVEGANATVNNYDILTKKQDDQDYIVNLIGGTATSANTPDTVVKRDTNGDFSAGTVTADLVGDVTGNVVGNVTGDVTGTVSSLSNHDTDDLAEGTNLYFTNQRALDATASAYDAAGAAATAESNAIAAAALDATTKADAAELDANSYTDAREAAITSAYTSYADQAELDAIASAGSYTDGREAAITIAYQAYADTAEQDAKTYADNKIDDLNTLTDKTWSSYKIDSEISTAVANLVDGAPALLDTLNELAAAIDDNPSYATDVANLVATKQNTLIPGTNISISNDEISVTGLDTDDVAEGTNLYFTSQRAVTANTGLWDTVGSADAAQTAAQNFATSADSTLYNTVTGDIATAKTQAEATAQGYANTAESNAATYTDNAIDALNTDDIEEGAANVYFTDARAKDSAAALLTNATLTNIQITGTGNGGLVITAENGVADSDTDDLVEGSNNLYFTDARAVSALEAVVPNFNEIDLNDAVTKVATQSTVPTASQVTVHEFDSAIYRSAEYTVKVAYGSHTELSKVMLTLDSADNIAITEYAVVGTNGSASSITADVNGGNVRLRVTPTNNNSVVTVFGTIIK